MWTIAPALLESRHWPIIYHGLQYFVIEKNKLHLTVWLSSGEQDYGPVLLENETFSAALLPVPNKEPQKTTVYI